MDRRIAKFLLLCWLIAFGGAFVMYITTPSKDFGFTAGMNRVGVFFGWQIAAAFLSIPVWSFGRNFEKKTLWRWLTRIPLIIAALLVLMVVSLFVGANLGTPAPTSTAPPSSKPTSPPAEPAQRTPN